MVNDVNDPFDQAAAVLAFSHNTVMFIARENYKWCVPAQIPVFKIARDLKYRTRRTMSSPTSMSPAQTTPQPASPKPVYPGLGLPLRHDKQDDYNFFPIGAHGGCYGADTEPLNIREVAMMSVMESLTDKVDWHLKVNNDTIVSKWRTEALAVPNDHWFNLATSAKTVHYQADGHVHLHSDSVDVMIPENIMSKTAFEFVCHNSSLWSCC